MRRSLLARLAFAALAVSPLGVSDLAAQKSLEIRQFQARIEVKTDRSLDVTERIEASFTGQWNGIYRMIPIDYRDKAGFNWSIGVTEVSATDDDGNALRVETERQG